MTIRVRRFHQHPWNNTIAAYEIIDDEHVRFIAEQYNREFLRDKIAKYGIRAARTFFANIKAELIDKLRHGDGATFHVSEPIPSPPAVARSDEEWKRLFGVTDG